MANTSKFSFTVDEETLEINAYVEGQVEPLIHQPDQPDGTPWESVEQATAWITEIIDALENPPAPTGEPAPVEE